MDRLTPEEFETVARWAAQPDVQPMEPVRANQLYPSEPMDYALRVAPLNRWRHMIAALVEEVRSYRGRSQEA